MVRGGKHVSGQEGKGKNQIPKAHAGVPGNGTEMSNLDIKERKSKGGGIIQVVQGHCKKTRVHTAGTSRGGVPRGCTVGQGTWTMWNRQTTT